MFDECLYYRTKWDSTNTIQDDKDEILIVKKINIFGVIITKKLFYSVTSKTCPIEYDNSFRSNGLSKK